MFMAATTTSALESVSATRTRHTSVPQRRTFSLLLPLLTLATLLINGYHPLAEDGGLYIAGVEYRLNPDLFPHETAFVTAHLRYSLFAPALAAIVRFTHLPLAWTLFIAYIFTLWLLLFAGLQLLRRCTNDVTAQGIGVALLGVWSTLPVAGTSLLLTDPYLTARSFTTPLTLLAIAYALDDWRPHGHGTARPKWLCALCLLIGTVLHPLMAICALAMVIALRLLRRPRPLPLVAGCCALALLGSGLLFAFGPPDPPAVVAASLSRYYWFLSQWRWYELFGLVGPFAVLLLLRRSYSKGPNIRALCDAAFLAGGLAIVVAGLFAHAHSATYLVARLQPLRMFLPVYAVMTLLLGASLADWLPARRVPAGLMRGMVTTVLLLSGGTLFVVQRATFPASQHIEVPWSKPANPWSRAFLWVRHNTPADALFALDPDYITTPGEDAHTFRASSLRSALPDFSKDGGEASITPSLAALWRQSMTAQFAVQSGTALTTRAMLSHQTDAERDARLLPLGVTWLVLHADAATAHPCPYDNGTVKVCRLTR